jgi:hypothetical protein
MKKSRLLGALCAAVFSFITLPAQAALVSVLGGAAVYDTDRNISWISNANLALTNQFGLTLSASENDPTANTVGSTGKMTWDNAVAWIAGMNSANYLGFNNWSLPDTPQPDASCGSQLDPGGGGFPLQGYGLGCTGSDMGHLYNVEGVTAVSPGLFSNVQSNYYWSSTQFAISTNNAWVFGFGDGNQTSTDKTNSYYALAVHSGMVPVPAAVWLFGSGVLALVSVGKQRRC